MSHGISSGKPVSELPHLLPEVLLMPVDDGEELELAEAEDWGDPFEDEPIELEFKLSNSPQDRFHNLALDGQEPLAAVMSFMVSGCILRALLIICKGDNWRKIAFALGAMFHTSETVPLRIQIARGHDRLRDLVTTCVTGLKRGGQWFPGDSAYSRMIERLFTSHGYQSP